MSGHPRESLFPSASIGRHPRLSIQRMNSHETLSAHPLLSPTLSPNHASSSSSSSLDLPSQTPSAAPRYVPYTPRQRVAPTAATTGATMHPIPSSQQPQGGATSKLQLMNLKAAAQNIGLDAGSIGWAILEKLESVTDHETEWNEIWSAITTGRASLLLPLEQSPSHELVTADFVKDHVVLCEGSSRGDAPVVFLSGVRGTLVNESLIIRSSLSPESKPFQAILNPASRSSALSSLPPLPAIPNSATIAYPSFSVPAYTPSLPLPPRPAAPSKPALPPRPGSRAVSASTPSRISNPFASLFGKPPVSSSPPVTSPVSPPASSNSTAENEHIVEVPAFTIDRRIDRKDLGKTLTKALKTEIEDALAGCHGLPSWVVTRVHNFTAEWYPLTKATKKSAAAQAQGNKNASTSSLPYLVNCTQEQETPEDVADRFQEFYGGLEDELRVGGRRKEEKDAAPVGEEEEQEKGSSPRQKEKGMTDSRIREILESVEKIVCGVFYDRLFRQSASDDALHDEALSSRIAALNMLDLGLEHLGVDAGSASPEVHSIVKACGETLSELEGLTCRSPADKAAVLVAAHKIVVDGLSKLPPIRLKSDAEIEDEKTPRASSFPNRNQISTEEEDEEDESASSAPSAAETFPDHVSTVSPPFVSSPDSAPTLDLPANDAAPPTVPDKLSPAPSALNSRSTSPAPALTISPPPASDFKPTPVSGDILLPLIIFAVVKANPPHLVSHLLYTQRFRNHSVGGEEGYCLINLMAVAEFLENVDLGALGLGEDEKKVLSAADLKPIPITRNAESPTSPTQRQLNINLRGRVEQQVDAIAGSANKMLSGVVDSSFGVLRAFLPGTSDQQLAPSSPTNELQESAPWNRPAFGLLRRESGFSIASLAASLPGRDRSKSAVAIEEKGQQMIEVSSRPGSVRSVFVRDEEASSSSETGSDDEGEEEIEEADHDTRSIRSFESMMSGARRRGKKSGRRTLADRLAQVPGLSRLSQTNAGESPPTSRRSSLLLPGPSTIPTSNRFDTSVSSRPTSPTPISLHLAPPKQRFIECTADDLKVSEVSDLLREYRRLVDGIRSIGGFDEA